MLSLLTFFLSINFSYQNPNPLPNLDPHQVAKCACRNYTLCWLYDNKSRYLNLTTSPLNLPAFFLFELFPIPLPSKRQHSSFLCVENLTSYSQRRLEEAVFGFLPTHSMRWIGLLAWELWYSTFFPGGLYPLPALLQADRPCAISLAFQGLPTTEPSHLPFAHLWCSSSRSSLTLPFSSHVMF